MQALSTRAHDAPLRPQDDRAEAAITTGIANTLLGKYLYSARTVPVQVLIKYLYTYIGHISVNSTFVCFL